MKGFANIIQSALDPKFKAKQEAKAKYLAGREALFARRMADELTLDEYKKELKELSRRHLID
jgi:hypothetical protein